MTILSDISEATAALVDKTAQRIVAIDAGHRHAASGIVWRAGLIVTANEALGDDEQVELTLSGGKTVTAKFAGRDASTDIALLRAEDAIEAGEPFKPAAGVETGHRVLAVGRSGSGPLASSGIVRESGASWHSWAGGLIDRRILLDLALDRRAHGGAVIDTAGDLIGIAAFAPRHQALVIPTQTVERIAERLETGGSIARGYLGAGLHPLKARADRFG